MRCLEAHGEGSSVPKKIADVISVCSIKPQRDSASARRILRKVRTPRSGRGSPTRSSAAGGERTSTIVAALIDTNIPNPRMSFDPADPRKQALATEILRRGLAEGSVRVPHQAIVGFVAVRTPNTTVFPNCIRRISSTTGSMDRFARSSHSWREGAV